MNYRIAVCDDREEDWKYLISIVNRWAEERKNTIELKTFSSAENFLFHYAEQPNFDILLLDIEMPGMNGVELAQNIRRGNDRVQIIFITGFPDFIAEGYEVAALHYLLKPVSAQKLEEVLDRAVQKLKKPEKTALFQREGEIRRIPIDQIVLVEAFAHSCVVTTTESAWEIKESISAVEKMLGQIAKDAFIRTHRSYLVGVRYIQSISKTDVTLDNDRKIPLSRGNYQAVHQAFIHYFKGESTWD
jgi:DNA-binding LytR/AlgR family response regulator